MCEAFQASERWHVLGFFDYCCKKSAPKRGQLLTHIRDGNWQEFAHYYNGEGQISAYSKAFTTAYTEACKLPYPTKP
jgi:hypothetical protein